MRLGQVVDLERLGPGNRADSAPQAGSSDQPERRDRLLDPCQGLVHIPIHEDGLHFKIRDC